MGNDIMFIVEFEDGTTGIEGTDFETWNDVPSDKRIAAVSLAAGPELVKTLRGYDKYLVHYEAITGIRSTVSPDGETTAIPWDKPPEVVAQKCYGFRRYGGLIHKFQAVAEKIVQELGQVGTLSPEAQQIFERSSQLLKKKMDETIQRVVDREIKCISIHFTEEFLSREKAGLNPALFREGFPDEIVIPSDDEIKKILLK